MGTYEGVDVKDAVKFFANQFQCGVANLKGTDQIEIQGSYANTDTIELIQKRWPQIESIKISTEGGSKKGRKKDTWTRWQRERKKKHRDIGQS